MKIDMTESDFRVGLTALLALPPVRALKGGALSFISGAVGEQTPWVAARVHEAAADLLAVLEVDSIDEVPTALAKLEGRPPKKVIATIRSADMVEGLRAGLCQLGFMDLMEQVAQWGPAGAGVMLTEPLPAKALLDRTELIDALRARAQEILTAWGRAGLEIGVGAVRVDGRTLATAARAWQIPLVNGTMGPAPATASALYANRLGRSAAAVAYSKINEAITTHAPIEAVSEPLALLVALGEAITPMDPNSEQSRVQASKGGLRVGVRNGMPVRARSMDVYGWWPVFSAWGSSERRGVIPFPTAWRLSAAEADVILWALTRVAAALAIAASAPRRAGHLLTPFDWAGHAARETPMWEQGASSVCELMQRGRLPQLRSEMPSGPLPSLADGGAWPWRPTPESAAYAAETG